MSSSRKSSVSRSVSHVREEHEESAALPVPRITELPPTPQDGSATAAAAPSFEIRQRQPITWASGLAASAEYEAAIASSPYRLGSDRSGLARRTGHTESRSVRTSPYLRPRAEESYDGRAMSTSSISDVGSPALSSSSGGCLAPSSDGDYYARSSASQHGVAQVVRPDSLYSSEEPQWQHERASSQGYDEQSHYHNVDVRQKSQAAPLPVAISIPRAGTTSHSRKKDAGHIPRPRNAFILFRSHAHRSGLVPKDVTSNHSSISVIISHMWRSLPPAEREMWNEAAEREKAEHRINYPDYKFKPVQRRANVIKRNIKREEGEEELVEIADKILKSYGRGGVVAHDDDDILAGASSEAKKKARRKATKAKSKSNRKASSRSSSGESSGGLPRATKKASSNGLSASPASTRSRTRTVEMQDYAVPTAPQLRRSSSVPLLGQQERSEHLAPPPQWATAQSRGVQAEHPASADPVMSNTTSVLFGDWQARMRKASEAEAEADVEMDEDPAEGSSSAAGSSLRQTSARKGPPAPFNFNSSLTAAHPPVSPTSYLTDGPVLPSPRRWLAGTALGDAHAARPKTSQAPTPISASFRAAAAAGIHWNTFDSMLVSPMRSSFGDLRRASGTGWQSWARLAGADVGLPALRPRGSFALPTSATFSNVGDESGDALFMEAARMAAESMRQQGQTSDADDMFAYHIDGADSSTVAAAMLSDGVDRDATPPAPDPNQGRFMANSPVLPRFHIDGEPMFQVPPPSNVASALARHDEALPWEVYGISVVGQPVAPSARELAVAREILADTGDMAPAVGTPSPSPLQLALSNATWPAPHAAEQHEEEQ